MPKKNNQGNGNKPEKAAPLEGSPGNDLFFPGTPGDDTIDTMGGDDSILASLGNDSIDGGDGTDLLIYDLLFPADDTDGDGIADFSVSRIEKGKNVSYEISYTVGGVTETDTVKNVEYILFSDGSVLDTVNDVLDPGDPPPPPPPPAPGTITFDNETPISFASTSGTLYDAYQSTDGYIITQQSTGAPEYYENVGALADYDATDPDFEFRVFTDPDGTTHEMAVLGTAPFDTFSLSSVNLTGLDAGETIEVFSAGFLGSSSVILSVDDGDISDGVLDLTTLAGFVETDVLQFSLVAMTPGTEFYVDDLLIV